MITFITFGGKVFTVIVETFEINKVIMIGVQLYWIVVNKAHMQSPLESLTRNHHWNLEQVRFLLVHSSANNSLHS